MGMGRVGRIERVGESRGWWRAEDWGGEEGMGMMRVGRVE